MSDKLIFNPFLDFHVDSELETDFNLFAPRPNVGLQMLKLSENDNGKLLNLIKQYARVGLEYIDIDNDLTTAEKKLLEENSVLIPESDKPDKPLFSCQLDDVEVENLPDTEDLFVNPTFFYRPMDLATFKEWIYQKNMVPNQATAWIKNPVTQIENGFWLTQEQAGIISKLEKGGKPSIAIDDELLQKLITAKIIVSKTKFENETAMWETAVEKSKNDFREKRYIAVENLLPKTQVKALQTYYRKFIEQGFMPFGDEFVKRRYRLHNESLARQIQFNFTHVMSLVTGQEVIPSYCYASSYLGKAELKPHTDREQCEFSISFQVDYQPSQPNNRSPWELHLATPEKFSEEKVSYEWDEFHNNPALSGKTAPVNLKNGDGLFYKGRDLIHYRYPLTETHTSTSLFFHYVPSDFDGDLE